MNACFVFEWKDKDLKLEHRLTLARMVVSYGIEGSAGGGVKAIASRLRLPVEMLSSVIRELTDRQYLVAKREGKIGRPSYSYTVGPSLKSAYGKAKSASKVRHFTVVEALILDVSRTGLRKSKKLSAVNAFVLAYLIYICGQGGVVPRLSKVRSLAELGITGHRLDSQLEKLRTLGLVRAIRPGVYSKRFLGVVPKTVVIDLERCFKCVGLSFDFEVRNVRLDRDYTVAEAVYRSINDRELVTWEEDNGVISGFGTPRFFKPKNEVLRYFGDQNVFAVQDALQVLLDVCACEELITYQGDTNFNEERFDKFTQRYTHWYLPNSRALPDRLDHDERWFMDKIYNFVLATAREIWRVCAPLMKDDSLGDVVSLTIVKVHGTGSRTFDCIVTAKPVR